MKAPTLWAALLLMASAATAAEPSTELAEATKDPVLRLLLEDVLERNPEIAARSARATALHLRAPQQASLPDPQIGLTAYLLQPETRVGAQLATVQVAQKLPAFGKLERREQTAILEAAAAEAEVEAERLRLITEARTLYAEMRFVDTARTLLEQDVQTLAHFEELARARYASGVGLQQAVIKVQAEISLVQARLFELSATRISLLSALNQLRERPSAPLNTSSATTVDSIELDWPSIRTRAVAARPEMAAAAARIAAAELELQLADRQSLPDFSLGLAYTVVERRDDLSGLDDNGKDILGLSAAINLPVYRKRLDAAVEEAVQRKLAAEAEQRAVRARIERSLAELEGTIPEIERRLHLFEHTLIHQSEHSLMTAEAAYSAGFVDALALLDARRVLFEVRLATERARTDLWVALGRLEGAAAVVLEDGERS